MPKSRFTEAPIVAALQAAEAGLPIADLLRQHSISRQTFYLWRSRYGGATVAELTKLKALEADHAKLKRMYAELAMEYAAIKDVLARALSRRPRSGRSLASASPSTGCPWCARAAWSSSRGRRTIDRPPDSTSGIVR